MSFSEAFAPSLPLQRARAAISLVHPRTLRGVRSSTVPRRPTFCSQSTPSSVAEAQPSTSAPPSASPIPLPIFRCPRCTTPLPAVQLKQLSSLPAACTVCNNRFPRNSSFVDLTVSPPTPLPTPLRRLRDLARAPREQALFQLPWVSYAYERGWRNSFATAGFPGIDKELDMLLDFAPDGNLILDMSCGSGLMARRLATDSPYRRVIAADYSEAMLLEAAARARSDVNVPEFDLVRADVSALPFQSDVFDTVHSGAALHCWPFVQDGLRELLRVLKPGGRLFATTFSNGLDRIEDDRVVSSFAQRVRSTSRARYLRLEGTALYRFFERKELVFLAKAAGFVDVDVALDQFFLVLRCRKPL